MKYVTLVPIRAGPKNPVRCCVDRDSPKEDHINGSASNKANTPCDYESPKGDANYPSNKSFSPHIEKRSIIQFKEYNQYH